MTTYRSRGNSPPPARRYLDPRASTGTVISSSFDPHPRYNPSHRGSLDPSRLSDWAYEAQPRKTYVESGPAGGTTSRTEYAVRPRKDSVVTNENRRLMPPPATPVRIRPVVNNIFDPRDRPRSPTSKSHRQRDDDAGYLYPASSGHVRNHQRHHSATPAEMDRLVVGSRNGREGGGYHRGGDSRQLGYPTSRPPIRISEDDGYSYTGPREQFDRDYPSQPRERRESSTKRERPVSVMGYPIPPTSRREIRESGPPPASRQLDRFDRSDPSRLSARAGHGNDSERAVDIPKRRHSIRNPVLHQGREEGYSSPRDDYEGRKAPRPLRFENEPRQSKDRDYDRPDRPSDPRRVPRSRDSSPERSGLSKGTAALGLGGLAAAGLSVARSKDPRDKGNDSDSERRRERRRRKNKDRDVEDIEGTGAESKSRSDRDRIDEKYDLRDLPSERRDKLKDDRHDAEPADDQRNHRKHRRRRHRHKDEDGQEVASESSSERPTTYPPRNDAELPKGDSRREPRETEESDWDDQERSGRTERDVSAGNLEQRTISPGEDEDERPRRVLLVEPPKTGDSGPKPRGILKPARAVPFPEDPNPTREGVAPLKEAGKDGVPPGARWTKISRVLVNPEALEKSHERFEERDDYVIVLRVITKEEIAKLAEKTREIREARELEWQEELEKKRRAKDRRRERIDYSSEEDEEEPQRAPPLALEPPPLIAAPEEWSRPRDQLGRPMQDVPVPAMAGLNLVPENYSTNV